MTSRVKGFIVTLAVDVREDDAEAIVTALGMVRGVVNVTSVGVDVDDHMNRQRIRIELERRLYEVLRADK